VLKNLRWKSLVTGVGTWSRADVKVPLCLEESVTSKGKDELKEYCADGKPTQIFGSNKMDREMIGLWKFLEELIEIKLAFVRDNIRFRHFSTTNQLLSCGFDCGRV
jgi:hypothetical protein